ncbi:MAG: type II secretion system F family protein [Candidatus Aenigmarchaeota archaeon]|nr:type II secretion system F family protein [Candidatus Aenigmarchaeota archaeon]
MKIERLLPKKLLGVIEKNLRYAGIEYPTDKFVNILLKYSLSISLIVSIFTYWHFSNILYSLLSFLFSFFGFFVVITVLISFIADRKAKFAEEVLPDVLQLIASNIRSGITPDKAIILAARPEFGILEREIKLAAKKAMTGYSLENALMELGSKIKSKIVERTFRLIAEGMRKGGEIAELLESTAEDIRNLKTLKKEIRAQVTMYVIFIFIAVGIAAPILYSFTSQLMETMSEIGQKLELEKVSGYGSYVGVSIRFVALDVNFIRNYSIAALTITSIFGGLLLGLLQEGTEKAGIKYIPILLLLNFLIFFAAKIVLQSVLGTIVGITPHL